MPQTVATSSKEPKRSAGAAAVQVLFGFELTSRTMSSNSVTATELFGHWNGIFGIAFSRHGQHGAQSDARHLAQASRPVLQVAMHGSIDLAQARPVWMSQVWADAAAIRARVARILMGSTFSADNELN